MTVELSLARPPFGLVPEDVAWVRRTRDGLSTEDKVRQLFLQIYMGDDPAEALRLAKLKPAGVCRFMGPDLAAAWAATRRFLEESEIPPFICGDIEGGSHGSAAMLHFPNQLGLAAANDIDLSRRLLEAVCAEAKALGFNWSFTPVIDVNQATASAIVGTRSYGSDPAKIIAQALAHVGVLQANGIAATAKHWPGEGYDARDQHLVTTINPLAPRDWEAVFGRLYRGLIDADVMSVMSAHIALPAYAAKHGVSEGLERYRPASVSRLLNQTLLRGELGFNGLITSDATPMAGFGSWAPRAIAAPEAVESGCDVFLFSPDEARDFGFMMDALRDRRLSEQRLEDAVTRILGLKAALGLHRRSLDERLPPLDAATGAINSPAHRALAREAAARSITLVKDTGPNLPLDPRRHRRVVIVDRGAAAFFPHGPRTPLTVFRQALASRGFEIRDFDPADPPSRANADVLIYALATESSLGQSRIYLDWAAEQPSFAAMMDRYWHDIPAVMVSFGHPYYLFDAPRAPTYVNAYSAIGAAQEAAARCLMGEAPFTGESPIDPFAGAPDAKY
jgi:beta-N-acetylhexosaminidase